MVSFPTVSPPRTYTSPFPHPFSPHSSYSIYEMIMLHTTPSSHLSIQLSTQNFTNWTCPPVRLHPKVRTIFSESISSHATHVCTYLPDDMVVTWRQQSTGSRFHPDFNIFRVHNPNMLLQNAVLYRHLYNWQGTAVAQWLRCCATNRKVAGSIPAGVSGIFHWHKILPIALWPWGRLLSF